MTEEYRCDRCGKFAKCKLPVELRIKLPRKSTVQKKDLDIRDMFTASAIARRQDFHLCWRCRNELCEFMSDMDQGVAPE